MAPYHYLTLFLASALVIYLGAKHPATSTTYPYASFLHITSVGALFGITLWVTFFAGVLLFKYLPRHQFGQVQGKIFPYYFGFSFFLAALALGSWVHLEGGPTLEDKSVLALGTVAVASALQVLVFGPLTTSTMEARNKKEKEEGVTDPKAPGVKKSAELQALSKKFAKVHGLSSSANLVVVLSVIYQLYVLSSDHMSFAATAPAAKASLFGW